MSKNVFKSQEIAHVWAHQSSPSGRSPSAMSFNGPSFFSYSAEIGRIIVHKGSKAFILHQSKEHNAFSYARQGGSDYSVTTAEHVSIMRSAAEGNAPIFYARTVSEWTPKGLIEEAKRRIAEAHDFAKRAKKRRAEWDKEILGWIEKHNEIITFFGLRSKPIDAAQIEAISAKIEKDRRLAKRAELRKQIEARRQEQSKLNAWLNGGPQFNAHIFQPVFRIEKSELVSSYGARIPLAEAAFAIGMITGMRKSGTFGEASIPVGNYRIKNVSEAHVTAGCHQIEWSEIERVSKLIESLA